MLFSKAEAARLYSLHNRETPVQLDNSTILRGWLERSKNKINGASDADLVNLGRWVGLFVGSDASRTRAARCLSESKDIKSHLGNLSDTVQDADMHEVTVSLGNREFRKILRRFRKATTPLGVLGRFNPVRPIRRWGLTRWLESNDFDADDDGLRTFLACLELDSRLRPLRKQHAKVQRTLGLKSSDTKKLAHRELCVSVDGFILAINNVWPLATLILECPLEERAIQAAKSSPPDSIRKFLLDMEAACDQADARRESLIALGNLPSWIQGDWLAKQDSNIRNNSTDLSEVASINSVLSTVEDYQQFRVRSAGLLREEWAIFRRLRYAEKALEKVPEQELNGEIRRIMDREQRLSWKAEAERRRPEILADRTEIESKIRSLAVADDRMRVLNQQLLAKGINVFVVADRNGGKILHG